MTTRVDGTAHIELFVDGEHVDAQVLKITPEKGDVQRLHIEFPVYFDGFLRTHQADVRFVFEFDPPIAPVKDG